MWPTSHQDDCSLAGMEYDKAEMIDFIKMVYVSVRDGGKIVTFFDEDFSRMERILKENNRERAPR